MKYVKHLMSLLLLYSLVIHIIISHTDWNNNHGLLDDYLHANPATSWAEFQHRLSHFEHLSSECYPLRYSEEKSRRKEIKTNRKL